MNITDNLIRKYLCLIHKNYSLVHIYHIDNSYNLLHEFV